jgi:hypothetical protein
MSLKRGFKAEASRISLRLRTSLGLAPHAPIDLNALAHHLNVLIVELTRAISLKRESGRIPGEADV